MRRSPPTPTPRDRCVKHWRRGGLATNVPGISEGDACATEPDENAPAHRPSLLMRCLLCSRARIQNKSPPKQTRPQSQPHGAHGASPRRAVCSMRPQDRDAIRGNASRRHVKRRGLATTAKGDAPWATVSSKCRARRVPTTRHKRPAHATSAQAAQAARAAPELHLSIGLVSGAGATPRAVLQVISVPLLKSCSTWSTSAHVGRHRHQIGQFRAKFGPFCAGAVPNV